MSGEAERVIITRAADGYAVGVPLATYQANDGGLYDGMEIDTWEDGTPYTAAAAAGTPAGAAVPPATGSPPAGDTAPSTTTAAAPA